MKNEITILGKPYKIDYCKSSDINGMLGSANRAKQVIRINIDDQGPDQKKETLLHEVLHMVSDELKLGLTESIISCLAVGLYSAGYKLPNGLEI
jgi:hypothetical protein